MRRRVALALLLVLVLTGVSRSEPPPPAPAPQPAQAGTGDPVQGARCEEVVRSFVRAAYDRRFAEAFHLVRGLQDPDAAGGRFVEFLGDARASYGYKALAECQDNLFALAAALENRPQGPPPTLEALVARGEAFPQGLPVCPGQGTYRYRREGADYRVWCGTDAHAPIGIRGDFPAYSHREGLTLGNQELGLHVPVEFDVAEWSVAVEDYDEQFSVFVVDLTERSRTLLGQPLRERRSHFVLSCEDGDWKIDLALSNRDMAFVFDLDAWSEGATLARQVLFFYQLAESSGFQSPDIEPRALLEVRICEANLRALSLGVERWSVSHHGAYPKAGWADVVPGYLSELPRCPAGGIYRYRLDSPGSYRIWCEGRAHQEAGIPADRPALTPALGTTRGD